MSLRWDISKIKESSEFCWIGDRMRPQTDALIWASIAVGMGDITEQNWIRFWLRVKLVESVSGPFLVGNPLTAEDVKRHIGLHVNVSYETDAEWMPRFWWNFYDDEAKRDAARVGGDKPVVLPRYYDSQTDAFREIVGRGEYNSITAGSAHTMYRFRASAIKDAPEDIAAYHVIYGSGEIAVVAEFKRGVDGKALYRAAHHQEEEQIAELESETVRSQRK